MEQIEPEKQEVKTFDKCPCCGSEHQFFGDIVKRMKEQGLVKDDWNFCYDQRTGPVASEQMLKVLAQGSKIPSYFFKTDICSDCGCIYATKLIEGVAEKRPQIVLPTNIPMNRADRRRMERNN